MPVDQVGIHAEAKYLETLISHSLRLEFLSAVRRSKENPRQRMVIVLPPQMVRN